MNRPITFACLLAALLVASCSRSDAPGSAEPPADANAQEVSSMPQGDELNKAIQQPLDKARAVEGDLIQAREALDEEVDEQGG